MYCLGFRCRQHRVLSRDITRRIRQVPGGEVAFAAFHEVAHLSGIFGERLQQLDELIRRVGKSIAGKSRLAFNRAGPLRLELEKGL